MANATTPTTEPTYKAIDPRTGCHLRDATDSERENYLSQPGRPSFRRPVTVGSVLVDEYTGPGLPSSAQGNWAWL